MSQHLKKITTRAKQIRKQHPSMKWTNAIKQASQELRKPGTKRVARKPGKKHLKENDLSRCSENTRPNISLVKKIINQVYHRCKPFGKNSWSVKLGEDYLILDNAEYNSLHKFIHSK